MTLLANSLFLIFLLLLESHYVLLQVKDEASVELRGPIQHSLYFPFVILSLAKVFCEQRMSRGSVLVGYWVRLLHHLLTVFVLLLLYSFTMLSAFFSKALSSLIKCVHLYQAVLLLLVSHYLL